MRKTDVTQHSLYSYRTLEERIPDAHPLRKLRVLADAILSTMNDDFQALYSRRGRPSIAPERLLRASLIQTLFSIRSERQLVQHLEYNLLYRWFVGMNLDEPVWNHSSFSTNRVRLFSEAMTQRFFAQVLRIAEWKSLMSDEHFTVDGTMIEAWASVKSFTKKDGGGPPPSDGERNATVDFKGEKRSNETHQSTTDPDARLYKKGDGDKSRLCYLGHALMENRNGLVVDATTTLASGTAERDAALIMAKLSINKAGATLGADKSYDAAAFVKELRGLGVTPHVAQKKHSAIDKRTTRHAGYAVSIKKRKLVEESFGWSKTIGGLRKARFVGLAKVRAQTTFTFAAYNLTRMATIFGWRLSAVVG
ncbi:IS5 family transposase [Janthinobacterium sp. PSPC3-1]|uniref:IS5 family transposase n=1 Tax=Janthinobacterium sp. PSPC3-1 TaxID=2804653 RepID=UPI003CF2EA79